MAHEIDKLSEHYDPLLAVADNYGDICAAEITVDSRKIIVFAVYLSPNTTLKQAKTYMTRNLFKYNYDDNETTPVVVTGDFNIDISRPEGYDFVDFMAKYLKLELASSIESTTLGGSCIDMVFTRHVSGVRCKRFITYFSYHRPIVTTLCKLYYSHDLFALRNQMQNFKLQVLIIIPPFAK